MGDVIKELKVRSYTGEEEKKLQLYFDSGSPYTFIKKNNVEKFKDVINLTVPKKFNGPGNGIFLAKQAMLLEVKLLNYWCSHYAYVIENEILDDEEDVLIGHDFMQKFDVKLDLKKKDIILNESSLKRAQKVR